MLESKDLSDSEKLEIVKNLNLRFFSPLEVARLMCFELINNFNNVNGESCSGTKSIEHNSLDSSTKDSTEVSSTKAPCNLKFPDALTTRQKLQLLGNSVNVLVIASLMYNLFDDEDRANF
ncbi:hypothetical protein BB560_003651 [Smittium megazygosporum]|uniref:tRNA (cytosine(38)-C(5))-methyltransferase n=1 Tax=Smittium megazygosporum TaxID=133381 RepID=A0A2T9ZBH1_9FUNG|nr:hypothetical protein BB560_003651 [Smittium megazygosporum]